MFFDKLKKELFHGGKGQSNEDRNASASQGQFSRASGEGAEKPFSQAAGGGTEKPFSRAAGGEAEEPLSQTATGEERSKRFTLMAERLEIAAGEEFYVEGDLVGQAQAGERVTVLYCDGNIAHPVIEKVEILEKKGDVSADTRTARLYFSGKKALNLDWKYAVITDIPYQIEVDVNKAVENPYLLGLIQAFDRHIREEDFWNLFFRELVRSHYLLPVRMDSNMPKGQGGEVTLEKGMSFGVYRVSLNDGSSALPVYTDWMALREMAERCGDDWKRETMVMHFPQLVDMLEEGESIVVNPYGPKFFVVDPKTIANIVNSSGYQGEFGEARVASKTVQKDEKILLGYPAESEEVEAIRRRLVAFGKKHPEISMIDLLLKADEEGTQSYLVIVDVPEEGCRDYFGSIYNACRDLLHRVTYMDFVTLRRAEFARTARTEPPVYQR